MSRVHTQASESEHNKETEMMRSCDSHDKGVEGNIETIRETLFSLQHFVSIFCSKVIKIIINWILSRPNMVWISKKWHPKPSPLYFCFSCDHFEWPHDQFTTSLSLVPKVAKNGRKRPQMSKNGLNVWKVTSKTISIGFLLLLRSFWVVTWLVCNHFFYGTQNSQKWSKIAKNGPKMTKHDVIVRNNDWNLFILQIWSIFDCSRVAVPISPSGGVWTGQNSDFAIVKDFWWGGGPKLFSHQNWP